MRGALEPTRHVKELIGFLETAKRGILGPPDGAVDADAEEED
jgi:hypothetical protein